MTAIQIEMIFLSPQVDTSAVSYPLILTHVSQLWSVGTEHKDENAIASSCRSLFCYQRLPMNTRCFDDFCVIDACPLGFDF